jgi:hypothetical protein
LIGGQRAVKNFDLINQPIPEPIGHFRIVSNAHFKVVLRNGSGHRRKSIELPVDIEILIRSVENGRDVVPLAVIHIGRSTEIDVTQTSCTERHRVRVGIAL